MEEDLTDDDSTKDPISMPGRHDIDSDDSNPAENTMPTNDTEQSNLTSMNCLIPQTCSPKRLRKWREAEISRVFRLLPITFIPSA